MNWQSASSAGEIADGRLVVKDCIADAFLQNTLLVPENYSVIATLNLNGDYVSDQLAAMVGGIGIAPGANINYATGHAIFEATHGTAPDIAGKDIVNPCSIILSAVMMLWAFGLERGGFADRGRSGEQLCGRACHCRPGPFHAGWRLVVHICFYAGNCGKNRTLREINTIYLTKTYIS